jgi:hypothetical protein
VHYSCVVASVDRIQNGADVSSPVLAIYEMSSEQDHKALPGKGSVSPLSIGTGSWP